MTCGVKKNNPCLQKERIKYKNKPHGAKIIYKIPYKFCNYLTYITELG